MGEANFYWRVTLKSGHGENGRFDLYEYLTMNGAKRPENIPYGSSAFNVTFNCLMDQTYGDISGIKNKVLGLTPESPVVEHEYKRRFAI